MTENVQHRASGDGWELRLGDCLAGMRELADDSVDAIVTDPPAGIGFMGKDWDSDKGGREAWIAWLSGVMSEARRVIKPGGHALVWALPRTSHWTGTAIETGEWEIRDVHHHIFGTGFPKSLNVSSVMHELLGVTDGEWGTALKPAVEHWILARKPLDGTYAESIRAHGVGALNIGACRVAGDMSGGFWGSPQDGGRVFAPGAGSERATRPSGNKNDAGRWPAHLSLDEYAAVLLDEQAGQRVSGSRKAGEYVMHRDGDVYGDRGPVQSEAIGANAGDASRFFFVAKAPRAEKDAGLEHLARRTGGEATGRVDGSAGTNNPRAGAGRKGGVRNIHPTVKSIELMRWLVRLITPPGGLVLDMFAGSGTTGLACIAEDVRFLGFELGADYYEIAKARLSAASRQQRLFAPPPANEKQDEGPLQVDLFAGTGAA